MTELFKKTLLPASVDAAWNASDPSLAHLSPSQILVVARPFEGASKEESMLANLLKACGFAAGSANVMQLDEGATGSWAPIRAAAQPSHVLLFGVPPAQLGIQAVFPANAAVEFGGITFVWTSTLQHLTLTETARKSLWMDVLQPLFKKA